MNCLYHCCFPHKQLLNRSYHIILKILLCEDVLDRQYTYGFHISLSQFICLENFCYLFGFLWTTDFYQFQFNSTKVVFAFHSSFCLSWYFKNRKTNVKIVVFTFVASLRTHTNIQYVALTDDAAKCCKKKQTKNQNPKTTHYTHKQTRKKCSFFFFFLIILNFLIAS